MPKQGGVQGEPKEVKLEITSSNESKKKPPRPKGTKVEIGKLIRETLQKYHNSANLEERIRTVVSDISPGISTQDAREAAAGEIRAYHRSNVLSGKIEEEVRTIVDDVVGNLKGQSAPPPEISQTEMRKMLLSAFDQYHKSPQLERRIRKVMGTSSGVTRKEVEREVIDNLKKYHRSEQLRNRIRDISSSSSSGQSTPSFSEEQILELIREETETVLESEALTLRIEQYARDLFERLIEREMDRLLDSPDVEDRIRDICRSLAEETSMNLPVVFPGDLRTMVQEELEVDHVQHPIPEGRILKEPEIRTMAQKMAGKETTKLLQSAELRALIQTQAKMAAEKAVAPLPTLTEEDVARIAEESSLAREISPHVPSTEAMQNLIREISGEVARKMIAPLPTWSDIDQAVKLGQKIPVTAPPPASNVAQQVKGLVMDALRTTPFPEELQEETPRHRRRVRRKYRK